jgi:hypothetical protein
MSVDAAPAARRGLGVGAAPAARLAPARALRGLLVPVGLAIASAVLGWAAAAPIGAVRAPGPAPVDALLALCAALACAGLLALAAVGATVTLAVAVTGQLVGRWAELAQQLTPHVVRAAVGLVVGVTVVGGQGGPTTASVAAYADGSGERPGPTLSLPPDWSPDRPADLHPITRDPKPRDAGGRSDAAGSGGANRFASIVVHRGDTLWGIAVRQLGPGASNARVAAEWPRWHAANRSTIGPDPNLILPGQRLRTPERQSPADQPSTDREESR